MYTYMGKFVLVRCVNLMHVSVCFVVFSDFWFCLIWILIRCFGLVCILVYLGTLVFFFYFFCFDIGGAGV